MGINSSTRRVTVVNDNQSGVIRISESVVHKISQSQQPKQLQKTESQSSDEDQRPQQLTQQSIQPQQQQRQQSLQNSNQLFESSVISREDREREIRALEKSWKGQIEELQKQNRQLWRTANDKLSVNLSEVEKRLIKTKCQPICRQNEKQVVDCYQTNRSQPLKCSKEVKGFVDCVQEVRRSVINRNG